MSETRAIEQQAAVWRVRRDRPDWSARDQAELDAWLAAATAHRVAWLRMEYGWRRIDRLAALRAPAPRAQVRTPPRRLRRWMALAAMLAVVAVGALALHQRVGGAQRYATEVGGHRMVSLRDGSRLELNTDTALRTEVGDRGRSVWLDRGEAYFEIAHDATRPFVVHAGARRIVVLGTRFSVRRDRDRLEVAVADGRVRVEQAMSARPAPPAFATRGEIVVAEADSTLVVPPSMQRVDGELAWRRGFLVFDGVTLAEAAAEFNRYNRKKLVVVDPATGATRISGSFDATNVDAFARLLGRAYGLRIEDRGDRVDVTG